MNTDYVYLIVEVSVTIYVFLLGLPTLVSQILLSDDLRRMSKKNYTDKSWWHLSILTGLLLLILVIAYLCTVDKKSTWILSILDNRNGIVSVLFVLMTGQTLWFLYDNLIRSQGYRAKVIHAIKKRILKAYENNEVVDRAFFDDLEYVGIYSKAGAETRTFIEAMESLLTNVQEGERNPYDNGQMITNIIDILCLCVTNSTEPGSRPNMEDVLGIYKNILMDLSYHSTDENQLFQGNETRKIKDCTTRIALVALKEGFSDMMPLILNVLTLIPRSSEKLFIIGVLALEKEKFQIAANVLSEMMDRDNRDYLTMNNYLGLLAHFLQGGNAARKCAQRSLEANRIELSKNKILDAMEYHYIMSNFNTVDKLEKFKTNPPVKLKAVS